MARSKTESRLSACPVIPWAAWCCSAVHIALWSEEYYHSQASNSATPQALMSTPTLQHPTAQHQQHPTAQAEMFKYEVLKLFFCVGASSDVSQKVIETLWVIIHCVVVGNFWDNSSTRLNKNIQQTSFGNVTCYIFRWAGTVDRASNYIGLRLRKQPAALPRHYFRQTMPQFPAHWSSSSREAQSSLIKGVRE